MDTLHSELLRVLGKFPRQLSTQMINEKLLSVGVELSKSQLRRLEIHLLEGHEDTINFRGWQWWHQDTITLEFTDEDIERIGGDVDYFIANNLNDLISSLSADLSSEILVTLKKNWPRASRLQKRESKRFRKQLATQWGGAISLLRMLLAIANEFGESISDELKDREDSPSPHLNDVLTRLHARSCQVTEEIVCLLEAGFADGAMARWRTLHEIAAVSMLIETHGEDIAERYALHEAVETRRAARQYEEFFERLDLEPLEHSESQSIEESYAAVAERYGKNFCSQYGWSAHHLGNPKPKFSDIELASEIDHWRPYYKLASHNVHANPRGTFFRLGLLSDPDFLLAGPSGAGLEFPGHSAAISLTHISLALGMLDLTLDKLVVMQLMRKLTDEIGQAFGDSCDLLDYSEEEFGDVVE